MIGPVVMSAVGDAYVEGAQIAAIIWVGSTLEGDTVEIRHRTSARNDLPANVLWKGRTDSTNTYLGANIPPNGIHAPNGFYVEQISRGELLVYLKEAGNG
jgi:hypothetical protein